MNLLRKHWPAVGGLAILWMTVAFHYADSVARHHGQFAYALDDAYIHMAMARNVVQHGVWGITRHGFTSSSSSPLWTLLLSAVGAVAGIHDLTPLLLNTLFASALCVAIYAFLRSWGIRPLFLLVV